MPAYRLTLYKQENEQWEYCQITATDDRRLVTACGICGDYPAGRTETNLPEEAEPIEFVQQSGAQWRAKGYDYPKRKDMLVMSLQFRLPSANGWPAGAPWFEDWKTFYQEPIEWQLSETANGFANGSHRAKGQLLLYFYVLNPEAAASTVRHIAANAPVQLPMEIHIGEKPLRPGILLNHGVPDALADMYKGFEQMAITLAEASQSVVFHTVTLTPQVIHESSRQGVKGNAAVKLRQTLQDRWGFECNYWPPLGGVAKVPVVYTERLEHEAEEILLRNILDRQQEPVYLLDCEEGIFEIDPQNIFRGAYEGVVFDAGMEWIIYFSHHNTVTFGGAWLVDAVRDLYSHQPQALTWQA